MTYLQTHLDWGEDVMDHTTAVADTNFTSGSQACGVELHNTAVFPQVYPLKP